MIVPNGKICSRTDFGFHGPSMMVKSISDHANPIRCQSFAQLNLLSFPLSLALCSPLSLSLPLLVLFFFSSVALVVFKLCLSVDLDSLAKSENKQKKQKVNNKYENRTRPSAAEQGTTMERNTKEKKEDRTTTLNWERRQKRMLNRVHRGREEVLAAH
jgi:hypothetical protein